MTFSASIELVHTLGLLRCIRELHIKVTELGDLSRRISMHPPLHKNKHPHCVSQIDELEACHAENPIAKFWGVCNEAKWALDRCLREQKNLRRLQNKILTAERQERRQQKKEIQR